MYTNAHCDFVYVVPLPTSNSSDLTDSLYQFVEAVGVLDVLVTDDAPSLTGVHNCFVKACRASYTETCLPTARSSCKSVRRHNSRVENFMEEVDDT